MGSVTFPNGQTLTSTAQTPQQIETLFQNLVAQIFGIAVTTTATASSGSTSLTISSTSGVSNGQIVTGLGIQPGTTVTAVSGSTVTISLPTTLPLANTSVTFSNVQSGQFNTEEFNAPPNSQAWFQIRIAWQQQGQPAYRITDDVCIVSAVPDNDPFSQVRDQLIAPNDDVSLAQQMAYTQVWKLHFTLYGPNSADRARLIVSAMALDWTHDLLAQSNLYAVTQWNRPRYLPELYQGQWWQRADVDLRFNELVNESIIVSSAAGVNVTLDTDTGLSETVSIEA